MSRLEALTSMSIILVPPEILISAYEEDIKKTEMDKWKKMVHNRDTQM